jgi:hypothetical protein
MERQLITKIPAISISKVSKVNIIQKTILQVYINRTCYCMYVTIARYEYLTFQAESKKESEKYMFCYLIID